MKFVNRRHYFWHQQIPNETKPRLFGAKLAKLEEDQENIAKTNEVTNTDDAKSMATEQLVKVLEGEFNLNYQYMFISNFRLPVLPSISKWIVHRRDPDGTIEFSDDR